MCSHVSVRATLHARRRPGPTSLSRSRRELIHPARPTVPPNASSPNSDASATPSSPSPRGSLTNACPSSPTLMRGSRRRSSAGSRRSSASPAPSADTATGSSPPSRLGLNNGRLDGLDSCIRLISHRSFGFTQPPRHRHRLPLLHRHPHPSRDDFHPQTEAPCVRLGAWGRAGRGDRSLAGLISISMERC
jgi:hypothetical protein